MKAVIVALCLVRHAAAFGYFVDDHTTCSGCEDYDYFDAAGDYAAHWNCGTDYFPESGGCPIMPASEFWADGIGSTCHDYCGHVYTTPSYCVGAYYSSDNWCGDSAYYEYDMTCEQDVWTVEYHPHVRCLCCAS